MLKCIDLTQTVAALRSASTVTESTFLEIGQALEASIEILSSLTVSFETALNELKNDKLGTALKSLGAAAAQIAALGSDQSAASAKFADMQRMAEVIAERIAKLNRSVSGVGSLAINSKIAAASIRGSKIDFTDFADEIARTLKMTQSSLEIFGSGLHTVRTHVSLAYAGQLAFEKGQQEAARAIPERLTATVNAMPLQHRRNAQAIAAVAQRSERMRKQVNSAIAALQAGDMTRQRLEHADYALGVLATSHEPDGNAALSEADQLAFSIATCRLQAAQVAATAEEFERNVREITASLSSMANEAKALRSLANSTYGSGGRDQGTFIGDLEAQVGAALSLFEGYGTARAQAAATMTAVAAAAAGLCVHLQAVQSLEDDIRIMGLNTTLKCARLGPEGRALGLIAQELRACGNEFAKEANALIGEVRNLTDTTASFAAREPVAVALMTTVMQAMSDALASLREVGQTLDDTLSTLERDSERVVVLLTECVASLGASDGIGPTLRHAADNLHAIVPPDAQPPPAMAPRAQQMLDMMARSYTMASERVIHERILGRSGSAALAAVASPPAELEDMLF